MTRLRESTKNAEQAAWPAVKEMLAAQITPVTIDKLASSKQVRSNIRFVVECTIQQLALSGLLRTPADAELIDKAKAWHEAWGDERPDVDMDDENGEYPLYQAIEKLIEATADRPHV